MNNNYGILLNHIPYDLKKIFSCLERTCKKINNLVWSMMFNKTCLNDLCNRYFYLKVILP